MSDLTRAEYNDIKGKLKRRKEEIKNLVALFNAHTEVIKEGFECNRMTDDGFPRPDRPNVCDSRILNLRSTNQGGGIKKRKSRKKRGKGLVSSRMRKKHMSARQPKQKYVDDAIKILNNDQSYLIADTVERGRRIRNLALELEDNAKKGGRRKRKSRRKTKKKRRKTRNKKGGHHEAIVLGALALSKIFKNKKKKKKTRKKRRR